MIKGGSQEIKGTGSRKAGYRKQEVLTPVFSLPAPKS